MEGLQEAEGVADADEEDFAVLDLCRGVNLRYLAADLPEALANALRVSRAVEQRERHERHARRPGDQVAEGRLRMVEKAVAMHDGGGDEKHPHGMSVSVPRCPLLRYDSGCDPTRCSPPHRGYVPSRGAAVAAGEGRSDRPPDRGLHNEEQYSWAVARDRRRR